MTSPRLRRSLLALLVVVALGAAGVVAGLPAVGAWLVVADPLVVSDAIFVLEGRTPEREVEAAALYHRKLAPIVGISHAREQNTVARQLAHLPPGQETARRVLLNLGVPDAAIVRLEPLVENTVQEVAIIGEAARARGFRRVILVTSPPHTRRVRTIWDARVRDIVALVHPTPYEAYDARRWWRSRHGAEEVVHELGGLVNFRLGSLLPTFDEGR